MQQKKLEDCKKDEVAAAYKKLCTEIKKYQQTYYLGKPIVSDEYYDQKYLELVNFEKYYKNYIDTSNSPTKNIGYKPEGKTYKHSYVMQSLLNVWQATEVEKFYNKVKLNTPHLLENKKAAFFCTPKIDGIAISLQYQDGILVVACTRGDGKRGEIIDVTNISSIPKFMSNTKGTKYIRGELVIHNKDFKKHFSKQFSNPRNAVAGIVRRKDTSQLLKFCQFYPYEMSPSKYFLDFDNILYLCDKKGFNKMPYITTCNNDKDIIRYHNQVIDAKDIPFKCDGSVHKINDIKSRKIYGYTSNYPKWAIAYKTSSSIFLSTIKSISFQVGKTGSITPVAHVEPVQIEGTVVKKVTLHNLDELKRLKIGIGQTVFIKKAGQIIPKICGVGQYPGKTLEIPKACPSCNNKFKQENRCDNSWQCKQQALMRFKHFVSKSAFNIQGIGEKNLANMISFKIISRPSCIFKVKQEDLVKLPLLKQKKAKKIIEEINKSKNITLANFLHALCIPRLGKQACVKIANHHKDIHKIISSNNCDILGNVADKKIKDFFMTETSWIKELLEYVNIR